MSDPFDVRAAVKAMIDDTDIADPGEIAAKVGGQIPVRELRAVVVALLRDYIRTTFHSYPPLRSTPAPETANRSAKVRAIREAAPGWLRRRVHVGDRTYLVLAECTYANLRYLEQARLDKAAQNAVAAAWFARAAELVRRHRVDRLGALPAAVLATLGETEVAA